ncbi:MAG: energy transducer TonB [Sulfurovum sp.]|nr:energy transducer TonB [Sulfurovum sp.]
MLKGFVLSFLLHLFIFLLLFLSFDALKFKLPATQNKKKITLSFSQFTPSQSIPIPSNNIVKKKFFKKKIVQKYPKDKLVNALLRNPKWARNKNQPSSRNSHLIQSLYGEVFYTFTKTQQRFIKDHLFEIYRITQNTLVLNGYPSIAIHTRQQGTNVVSFYLYPNGDISNLKLIKPMGYETLDKNTISVIQIAYKDYPHPKTKTKIIFNVNYTLY